MKHSQKFWDRKAEAYSKSAISDEANYKRKLSETQRYLSADMRILELGCGTGSTAIQHAPYVKHIDAIDISENMLGIARKKAKIENIKNISFTRGTLEEFNADEASLDAVSALNVIHLLPNRLSAIEEVARILKPGGVFISSTACLGDTYFRFLKLIAPVAMFFGLIPDVSVFTKANLISDIEKAGFTVSSQWTHGVKDMSVFLIAKRK